MNHVVECGHQDVARHLVADRDHRVQAQRPSCAPTLLRGGNNVYPEIG